MLGFIYIYFSFGYDIFCKIKKRIDIKDIKTKLITVEIKNKNFKEGLWVRSNSHDSYLISFDYNDTEYTINNKEIFDIYEIGDKVDINLSEYFDKNNNIVDMKFKHIL